MVYYFFALLAAAVILLFNNYRSETNRWASFFLFSASIGGLHDDLANAGYHMTAGIVQFCNHTLTPYGVIVFSMVYAERFRLARTRLRLKRLLLIPPILMLIITPIAPVTSLGFRILLAWAAPYYLISCYWLIAAFWIEENPRKKRNRFVVTIIVVPTLLAALVFINVGIVVAPDFAYFRYVSLFIVYSLALGVLCTFLYGVLGVKLRFERDPLESTMKAVSAGASLLNHTIKNEAGKIAISTENLRRTLSDDDVNSTEHLQIITNATDHMMAMVGRIHSQMKDIALREEPCRLDLLTEDVLSQHRPLLQRQGIEAAANYTVRPIVMCDRVHLKEALGNIVRNAAEAMPAGGRIEVRLETLKRAVRLTVRDSGKGIPADRLSQVFEPFYSTKNGKMNFGLGLTYVYNVMRKSGGSVELTSDEGGGTVVTLWFPDRKRVRS